METIAVPATYNASLTRAERRLLTGLTSGASSASDSRLERRIRELADARTAVSRLPDGKKTERQRRAEKAAMLKERLKLLKQMIPFLGPSAAKSLRTEMQQISSQIASLGSTSGTGLIGTGGIAADVPAGADPWAEPDGESGDTTAADGASRDSSRDSISPQSVTVDAGSDAAEEKALQDSIAELQRLHRGVKALLRRKLQLSDGESERQKSPAQIMVYLGLAESGRKLTFTG